jgi:hypothetical protein
MNFYLQLLYETMFLMALFGLLCWVFAKLLREMEEPDVEEFAKKSAREALAKANRALFRSILRRKLRKLRFWK